MIDTIKLKIQISPNQIEKIKILFIKIEKMDYKIPDTVIYRVWNGSIRAGSYSKEINLYIPKTQDSLFIEFSVPKQTNFNNIQGINKEDIINTLSKIKSKFLIDFNLDLGDINYWDLYRVDYCYNWNYRTHEEATNVLNLIRRLQYPRKKAYFYDTSLMFKGQTFTVKFYLKYDEYLKHDYKELYEYDPELGDILLEQSRGVLRYELTMRRQKLITIFGKKDITVKDLLEQEFQTILRSYLDKLFKYINLEVISENLAYELLCKKFETATALRLYQFWKGYYSTNEIDRHLIESSYSRQQIYRNKVAIKKAGVGLNKVNTLINENDIKNLFLIKDEGW